MPRVDVIVPTHNRNARLERTLRALALQTFADFRVIVTDDASPRLVEPRTQAGAARVEVIRLETNGGPARARNAAVAAGSGALLGFCDDDVDPSPKWLETHVAAHEAAARLVSIGPLLAPADWNPTPWNWWEAETLAREYRRMADALYEPTCRQLFTGNAMIPRDEFEAAGGFDESLLRAEDVELGLRLHERGCTFAFLPGAGGLHYSRRSFESWLRMARQYAAADAHIDLAHRDAGWLSMINAELATRSPVLRAARTVAALPGGERVAAALAALGSRAAFATGHRRASTRLLSGLYDITYWNAGRQLGTVRPPAGT